METINTVVVGAGQAGIAASEHLHNNNIEHVLLERARIAERWRSGRWDSLVANGPAWHDRFPNLNFPDFNPDAFPDKERVADYFVEYAQMIKAPIQTGIEVLSATRNQGKLGFHIKTSKGVLETQNIIVATGAFQHPVIPPIMPKNALSQQLHSFHYYNPEQLKKGAVLVVGAGSSGAQIADELLRAGRRTYLSVGAHNRPPREYRGRDFVWWLGVLGLWDLMAKAPGTEHVTIAVSGAYGGKTIDFREFAARGMTLLGLTREFNNGQLTFASDLKENIEKGDKNYLNMLDMADAYVKQNGLALPEEPEARQFLPLPASVTSPILSLDLKKEDIQTIIWATGFSQDFDWLKVDAFDDKGQPKHQRGVSCESGIYFLGLPWQSRRGSSFIWGVWHDAKHVADHIAGMRNYHTYLRHEPAKLLSKVSSGTS